MSDYRISFHLSSPLLHLSLCIIDEGLSCFTVNGCVQGSRFTHAYFCRRQTLCSRRISEWWTEEERITMPSSPALARGLLVNGSHGPVIYLKAIIRRCTITKAYIRETQPTTTTTNVTRICRHDKTTGGTLEFILKCWGRALNNSYEDGRTSGQHFLCWH